MSSSVEKIKEKLTIVDVLSSYLKLEKAGSNYKAVCPFHNEKTPSFFVSPARGSYYCFGCGAKGDIFTFVEQFEGTDFKGALKVLAARAGVELEPYRGGTDTRERGEKDRLYALMEEAAHFYQEELAKTAEARDYVKSRGITEETTQLFRIGYALPEWRALADAMRKKGFTDAELITAGLAKHPDDKPQGEIYDRFRDRIMFPISDTGGRVIAFSGRVLHTKEGDVQGKYINSPETPIFKKGSTLYGLDKAKFEIRKRDQAILVEGQMDLVLSHQAGFENTVASSGTALSDSRVADIERGLLSGLGQVRALTENLVVAFDGDRAGLRAAGRAERIGLSLGMNVKVAKLPSGMDPADVIRTEGAPVWKKIVAAAEHIIPFYLSVLDDHPLSPHTRVRAIRDKILPYVAAMPSAVERAHFIHEIARRTDIAETALTEDVSRLMQEATTERVSSTEASVTARVPRTSRIEDRLFGILFWQESVPEPALDVTKLRALLTGVMGDERVAALLELSPEARNERIFEVELLYTDSSELQRETDQLIQNLEEEMLGATLESLMRELAIAERTGENEAVQALLTRSRDITARLNTIKSSRFK